MKILLLGMILFNIATAFATDSLTEQYPPYGGILTFQGQDNHQYPEFHGRSFWVSCLDKLEKCQEFISVMKSSNGETFIGKQINADELPQILKNIDADIMYTYGMTTEVLSLTSKNVYSKTPGYIHYPLITLSLIGDFLKLPYSIPVGMIKKSTLHSQIENQFNHLFKKDKLNQTITLNFFEGNDGNILNFINLELSKSFGREL